MANVEQLKYRLTDTREREISAIANAKIRDYSQSKPEMCDLPIMVCYDS